jgi:hypothetical protein
MSHQSRYSRKAEGVFIERDGLLENRVVTMPLPKARLWVRNLKAMYDKMNYETRWNDDGSATIYMPGWERTFEAVAL